MNELDTVFRDARVLVSDFDATMTEHDFFERALAHLPSDLPDYFGQYVRGEITHFEALRAIFQHLPDDEQRLLDIAHEAQLDLNLATSVSELRQAGWNVVVVSAGCQWYIDRLLAERQVELPVVSNPGRLRPGLGLEMILPGDSPYYSPETGIDKGAVVRRANLLAKEVAFAGDGRADLEAALLVEPRRRFAKGWLAETLAARGASYRPFDKWSDVAQMILEATP